MKEENEITQEVKKLLDSLEQHGQNARRQKELSDLIDSLEAGTGTGTSLRAERSEARQSNLTQTKPVQVGLPRRSASFAPRNDAKRRRLYPLWWIVGAAAACLLLWLLAKPTMKKTPNMNEEILVEEIGVKDTIQEENEAIEESVVLEEPIIPEKLMAEEMPVKPTIQKPKALKSTPKNIEEPILAENTAIESTKPEPTDTLNIGSNPTPNVVEEPIAVQSPQRRVIRSLNLVCYECQKEPENNSKSLILNSPLEKTIFGQPQDPNMKNGSLAFEVKLH